MKYQYLRITVNTHKWNSVHIYDPASETSRTYIFVTPSSLNRVMRYGEQNCNGKAERTQSEFVYHIIREVG